MLARVDTFLELVLLLLDARGLHINLVQRRERSGSVFPWIHDVSGGFAEKGWKYNAKS